eukprot:Awhi_evm1s15351
MMMILSLLLIVLLDSVHGSCSTKTQYVTQVSTTTATRTLVKTQMQYVTVPVTTTEVSTATTTEVSTATRTLVKTQMQYVTVTRPVTLVQTTTATTTETSTTTATRTQMQYVTVTRATTLPCTTTSTSTSTPTIIGNSFKTLAPINHSTGPCRLTNDKPQGIEGTDFVRKNVNILRCRELCVADDECVAIEAKVNVNHNGCELWKKVPNYAKDFAVTYTCELKQ